ncbi:hypothetical protein AKJ54_00185 [candidate division MSBL1 archaeon SCGC-AAA382K21]|uniref:Uncharacterized protein n=1 Tax=candidate division MSBL1 archaeon SCGC-AAA382K21 TaxID=1698283 RepID=A0A133VLX8_9EURY|nr:hypothetical protein AKJ54_00185 [candidate division MSBL1 archaeon SCGC-AAA382K21]
MILNISGQKLRIAFLPDSYTSRTQLKLTGSFFRMPDDEEDHHEETYEEEFQDSSEDEEKYLTEAKLRKMKLLNDQLREVNEELKERRGIHEKLMDGLDGELDYWERMLERVKKYGGHASEKKGRRRELEEKIDNFRKERWREQVKAWRGFQDLLRGARGLNRAHSTLGS